MTASLSRAYLPARTDLVRAAARVLRSDGWSEVRARGCADLRAPQAVVVPELNVPLQPDLSASHPARRAPLLACVGVDGEQSEAAIGRRWQALAYWARLHHANFTVFVRPQDYARAAVIATRWRVAQEHLRRVDVDRVLADS